MRGDGETGRKKISEDSKKDGDDMGRKYFPTRLYSTFSGNELTDRSVVLCVENVDSMQTREPWCVNLFDVVIGPKPDYDTCRGAADCLPAANPGNPYVGVPIARRDNSDWFTEYGKYIFTLRCCNDEEKVKVNLDINEKTEEVDIYISMAQGRDVEDIKPYFNILRVAAVQKANGEVALRRLWQMNNNARDSDDRLQYEIINGADKTLYGVGGFDHFRMELQEKRKSEWYIAEVDPPDCYDGDSHLLSGEKTILTECFGTSGKEVIVNSEQNCLRVLIDYNYEEEADRLNEDGKLIFGTLRYRLIDNIEKTPGSCEYE